MCPFPFAILSRSPTALSAAWMSCVLGVGGEEGWEDELMAGFGAGDIYRLIYARWTEYTA